MATRYEYCNPGGSYPGITQENLNEIFYYKNNPEIMHGKWFDWRDGLKLPEIPYDDAWAASNSSMAHQFDDEIDEARVRQFRTRKS